MQDPDDLDVSTEARPLPTLSDLVAAARSRRKSPNALRDAVARRIQFLRRAAETQGERLKTLVAPRERLPVRDEVCAMAHVLRVRARLSAAEQRAFDQLVTDYTQTVLALLVDRSEDDALEAIRRQLAAVSQSMLPVPD